MATTTNANRIDPTRAFYAAVGSVDVAVAFARTGLAEAQTRLAEAQTRLADAQNRLAAVDLEPKVLVDGLQKEAKALPGRVEALLNEYVTELGGTVEDLNKQYADLATRGRTLVSRIRRQEATQEVATQAKRTTTRAKTATTQTRKAASTAKSSAKATGTSARKTASATKKATRGAAAKTGA
jgi:chromosome segregation ATPase